MATRITIATGETITVDDDMADIINGADWRFQEASGVYITGVFVSFDELTADVVAAKEKGLSGKWAFTPETVEALLNYIVDKGE